jgi:hypothetical protein
MQDIENTNAKPFCLLPLLFRTFLGFWGQEVVGDFGRDAGRFQLRTSGVQYGLRGLELADQGIRGTEPESANQRHAQGRDGSALKIHALT